VKKFIRSINVSQQLWKDVQAKLERKNRDRPYRETMSGLIEKALTAYLKMED